MIDQLSTVSLFIYSLIKRKVLIGTATVVSLHNITKIIPKNKNVLS